MQTQNAVMLAALKKRSLTSYYCTTNLGIGCPTKRISELKQDVHDIETIPTKLKTRWWKSVIATWVLK